MNESLKGPKFILALVSIIVIGAVMIVSIVRDRIVNYPQWQVSVTGQGKVTYKPDTANITLGVQIDRAASAESALKQLNDKMARIIPAVKKLGIADESIKTQSYSVYPQYDYANNVSTLAGYTANQQLTIKVKTAESDLTSQVISEASKAGANQVLGITFDASNLNDLKQEARIKAIQDARGRAGAVAKAAGVRLGKVVGWYDNVIQGPGIYNYADGKGGGGTSAVAAPQVPVGSDELVVEVSLNFRVK